VIAGSYEPSPSAPGADEPGRRIRARRLRSAACRAPSRRPARSRGGARKSIFVPRQHKRLQAAIDAAAVGRHHLGFGRNLLRAVRPQEAAGALRRGGPGRTILDVETACGFSMSRCLARRYLWIPHSTGRRRGKRDLLPADSGSRSRAATSDRIGKRGSRLAERRDPIVRFRDLENKGSGLTQRATIQAESYFSRSTLPASNERSGRAWRTRSPAPVSSRRFDESRGTLQTSMREPGVTGEHGGGASRGQALRLALRLNCHLPGTTRGSAGVAGRRAGGATRTTAARRFEIRAWRFNTRIGRRTGGAVSADRYAPSNHPNLASSTRTRGARFTAGRAPADRRSSARARWPTGGSRPTVVSQSTSSTERRGRPNDQGGAISLPGGWHTVMSATIFVCDSPPTARTAPCSS